MGPHSGRIECTTSGFSASKVSSAPSAAVAGEERLWPPLKLSATPCRPSGSAGATHSTAEGPIQRAATSRAPPSATSSRVPPPPPAKKTHSGWRTVDGSLVPESVTLVPPATGPSAGWSASRRGSAKSVKLTALARYSAPKLSSESVTVAALSVDGVSQRTRARESAVASVKVSGCGAGGRQRQRSASASPVASALPSITTRVPPATGPALGVAAASAAPS